MVIEPDWTNKDYKYVCKNEDLKGNKILYIFKNKDIIWIVITVRSKKMGNKMLDFETSKSSQEKGKQDKQWSTKLYVENYSWNSTNTGGESGVP